MAGKDSGTHGQTETQSTQNAIEVVAWTIKLRAGLLDHGKDVHQLRILEEWSNMIGYKKGSSPARVLHCSQDWMRKWHDNSFC